MPISRAIDRERARVLPKGCAYDPGQYTERKKKSRARQDHTINTEDSRSREWVGEQEHGGLIIVRDRGSEWARTRHKLWPTTSGERAQWDFEGFKLGFHRM